MASKVQESHSVESRKVGAEHSGTENSDAIIQEKRTVHAPTQRRRLSSKSSLEIEIATLEESENEVVSFGAEDTVFTVKGGLIEGEVTIKEIADAINECARKDDDVFLADESDETDPDIFEKVLRSGRRRSSVLRDKELEAAAASFGDRMI